MRRRAMLQQALTALAVGAGGPALDVIRTGLVASLLGQDAADIDVAEWEEVAEEYGRAYYTTSPVPLMQHLAADLADLQQTLAGNLTSRRRADLSRVGAQLATVMAMSLAKAGQFHSSHRWWRACRKAADASTDPAIRVWVRGQEAVHTLYDRRPTQAAIDRAGEAVAISGGLAYPGTAEALGACAQACALIGDAPRARAYTNQLRDVFGKLPDNVTADTGSLYNWPQRRLWHTASYVHSHLGRTGDARQAQEHALALMPDWAPAARAQIDLHTAMCLIRDGHLDDGANHARQAITALPWLRRSALVSRLGHAVLEAVPDGERHRPSVAGFRDVVTASTAQVVS